MEQLAALIKQLELRLLHTDMCVNPSVADALLSERFEEIGNDGRVHSRQAVIEWLLHKDVQQKWSLEDFRVKMLSNDVILAVYRAEKINLSPEINSKTNKGSLRSSIWQRHGDSWKMVFHQATKQQ
ncbi:DUF4440 domain-containing protein [Nitrosomonas aestuarii]|uniref:DUF4440 domain-containing protein n=1 Tax=Nitrosomonas aestuarii TaxID=52441 RepID=A0A1I4CVU0_9PROT|nr:DUF4440 domain-containing protein [Nitrosomonas aestuarii]PTN11762.1 hypothetical protein C8R11_10747 [Nitrosomonas aestuarii]SFK84913.1 hypothetical protein SAMN05216302_101763 [Nitrosomonas aestuarii]